MSDISDKAAKQVELPCRVAVERSNDYLSAHVILGHNQMPEAGDSVLVHGDEIQADHDQRFILRRRATLKRSGPLTRAWTKFTALFEILELFEVSFSGRRKV
ncbi:MAG: hypothetical protein ACFB22_05145 [Rhodothalassiaceae bacterium]